MNSIQFKELEKRAKQVHSLFIKNQWTLAVAESCTGGLVSYGLSLLPGASQFFLGSIVSYSLQAKIKSLNIPADLLRQKGAVNKEICELMAQGVKKKWKSDWAISVTGVAGPERMAQDPPVGVVFVGVLGPSGGKVQKIFLSKESGVKNRKDIQHQSAIFALDFLQSRIR